MSSPAGGSVTLTLPEFDFLWERLGLGPRPTTLDFDSHGRTMAERDRLRETTWDALHDKGLVRQGTIDRRLATALTTLARPTWEIDARLDLGSRVTASIAASRSVAVRACLRAKRLILTRIEPSGLTRAAVALLPRARPGTGVSITVPSDTIIEAARENPDPLTFQRALIAEGVDRDEARKLGEVLHSPVRKGQWGVTYRPPDGPPRRGPYVITFCDSASGRYLFTAKPHSGSRRWSTLVPADNAKIVAELDRLRAELTR